MAFQNGGLSCLLTALAISTITFLQVVPQVQTTGVIGENLRVRRGLKSNQYIIETVVVVEPLAVFSWKRKSGLDDLDVMKKQIESMFVVAQDMYGSLSKHGSDLDIKIELKDIIFSKYGLLPSSVNSKTALNKFQSWMSTNYPKKYDMGLLFVGSELVMQNHGPYKDILKFGGYANIANICLKSSLAVLQWSGSTWNTFVIPHEMGHVLGAHHDGLYDNTACTKDTVMKPGVAKSSEAYLFSKCSYDSILKTVKASGDCLKKGGSLDKVVKGPRFGEIVTADKLCARFGKEWLVDRQNYTDYSAICSAITCTKGGKEKKIISSASGLPCGKNKECIQGQCVKTSKYSDVTDTCPLGDQPFIPDNKLYNSCNDLDQAACSRFKAGCCITCKSTESKVNEADELCVKLKGKGSALIRNTYHNQWDTICSKGVQCYTYFGYDLRGDTFDAPEGFKCGKSKVCRNKKCVTDTKAGDPSMSDDCPYGDQPWFAGGYKRTCAKMMNTYGCGSRWGAYCCETCRGKY